MLFFWTILLYFCFICFSLLFFFPLFYFIPLLKQNIKFNKDCFLKCKITKLRILKNQKRLFQCFVILIKKYLLLSASLSTLSSFQSIKFLRLKIIVLLQLSCKFEIDLQKLYCPFLIHSRTVDNLFQRNFTPFILANI